MPPFLLQGLESMGQHGIPQDHPVPVLFVSDSGIVRVAQFPEVIEGTSHIRFFFGFHIKKGQIHRAAPAVAGLLRNVPQGEQRILFKLRIKVST